MSETWEQWYTVQNSDLPLRIVHNDTNADNILMDDRTYKGKCMIDLDSVASGSLIFDFGDCVQDFLARNAVLSEAERMRELSYFAQGYSNHARDLITSYEIKHLYQGIWLVCMELAIRFLNDYLCHNPFFGHRIKRKHWIFQPFRFLY